MSNKIEKGMAGEEMAAKYLQSKGFSIIAKNWRYSRLGEIDIIAEQSDTLVFIEVKTRSTIQFGHPLEAINQAKMSKIRKLAEIYINSEQKKNYKEYRFDIVGIILTKNPEIIHYENILE